MEYFNIYNYERDPGTVNNEPSMTQESDAMETDINFIVKRFGVTGQLPQVNMQPLYGDFTDVGDYRTAVERINAANTAFMGLPAETRKRFDNDPQKFVDFATNKDNLEELRKMGLAPPAPEPTIKEPAPAPAPKEGN